MEEKTDLIKNGSTTGENNEKNERNEITKIVLDELIVRGYIHKTFDLKEKTKDLIKNLPRLDIAVRHYEKDIKRLESSKNYNDGPRFKLSKLEQEIKSTADNSLDVIDARIKSIKMTIKKIESFKTMINEIISEKLSSEDANILKRVYQDKVNADDIAVELNCDKSTVYRRISKAIDDIKVELFASDYVDYMS